MGNPFSTISSLAILHELGLDASHEAVSGGLALILAAVREDGRIRVAPKAPLYPCYTAEAARTLCRFGLADDPGVRRTASYLLESAHDSGGWRCSFSRFGKGPETQCANPGATLYAPDVLRFFPTVIIESEPMGHAVESLLAHWTIRTPIGPCHHGIGSRFLRVEFPFLRYNLFYYIYVLSFFTSARSDPRFRSALTEFESRVTEDGSIVVEESHRGLKGLAFCAKGQPSAAATRRYEEIQKNLAG